MVLGNNFTVPFLVVVLNPFCSWVWSFSEHHPWVIKHITLLVRMKSSQIMYFSRIWKFYFCVNFCLWQVYNEDLSVSSTCEYIFCNCKVKLALFLLILWWTILYTVLFCNKNLLVLQPFKPLTEKWFWMRHNSQMA